MGHFFAASAFRNVQPDALAQALSDVCAGRSVKAEIVTHTYPVKDGTDVLLYAPLNGWATVLWPSYFNIHDVPMCAALTERLRTAAVTVNVYDGAFWSQEVIDRGALVDKFSSWGDYFSEDETSALAARADWQGDPQKAAAVIGCDVSVLVPYYRYVGEEGADKALPDDRFPLEDFWVFTDLWRRAGLPYPEDPAQFLARVRLERNFASKLPAWEGETF